MLPQLTEKLRSLRPEHDPELFQDRKLEFVSDADEPKKLEDKSALAGPETSRLTCVMKNYFVHIRRTTRENKTYTALRLLHELKSLRCPGKFIVDYLNNKLPPRHYMLDEFFDLLEKTWGELRARDNLGRKDSKFESFHH